MFSRGGEPYFGFKGTMLTFWITVACGTDMLLFGYDQGVFGGVVVTPQFLELLNLGSRPTILSTVTAIYDVGCFFGAISVCFIGEPLGRKKCVLLGTTILSIGAILQITAFSLGQMITGRVIAGIGNGINTSTAPVWQGECSKASWRGKLIVIEMILNIFGFMMSNWVTYGFSFVDNGNSSVAWRLPLVLQFIFIFILYATVPWLPESPRWLMSKGKVDEAEQVLAAVEGTDVNDPWLITQSKDIQWAVQYEKENAVRWRDLLLGRSGGQAGTHTFRRLILGMGTQAMQQLSGINVTSYYLPTVLIESVGLSNSLARLLAACNSVSYLLFSLIGIPNVERWGRRKMMMYAAAGQFFCYVIITICIRYNEDASIGFETQRQWAKGSIAFFFLYYVFFGIGWQGVPWLYPTEINSMAMRTKGAALGTATNWIFNFMVVEVTPPGIASLHWRFYIIWTVFNFAFIPIVYFFYPETAGRTLEDIDRYFTGHAPLLVFLDKEAIQEKRPEKFVEREQTEYRRNSSVVTGAIDPAALLRSSYEKERDSREEIV
ncbi:general substrate transporter [Paraphaeosphaeria sporulosa]|uniref:General substrate transporter n=1 Tax=Paraphaeosphaeria sporulosa TaxID=1460663 RepID=A0A177CUG2_9PLEO|nr:general substrate transporter [Paraphaeosphaeria sporulosa]OAG10399.1 general substrate transporter [Paraphaeosphaeria sporulosa]